MTGKLKTNDHGQATESLALDIDDDEPIREDGIRARAVCDCRYCREYKNPSVLPVYPDRVKSS